MLCKVLGEGPQALASLTLYYMQKRVYFVSNVNPIDPFSKGDYIHIILTQIWQCASLHWANAKRLMVSWAIAIWIRLRLN